MQTKEEILIGSKLDAKGFKQAETALSKLGKSVKQLGAAFGVTFGAKLLVNYSKNAIRAFAEQEAETVRLTQSIKNLGLAFGTDQANAYIDSLEKITGINRDQLQPAYVRILQTTGSLVKTQEILNQSLDVAAATGIDVLTVSQSLSQAYVGNTRGLRQLNLGLTKTELASASFLDIQKKLNELFAGQAKLAAGSYTAQINRLSIASEQASEVIGGALVESLQRLSGSKDVDELVTKMERASEIGAGLIKTFTGGAGELVGKFFAKPSGMSTTLANQDLRASNKAAAIKAESDAKKRAAAIAAEQKKLLKVQKDSALVKKASAIFDLAQIQIVAALKGKVSEEDRKRLELQMAILSGNADEVIRVANELANVQGKTEELSFYLRNLPTAKNPFSEWSDYLDKIAAKIASLGVPVKGQPTPPPTPPQSNNPMDAAVGGQFDSAYRGQAGGLATNLPTVVNIYPQGNVITERDLATMLGASLETSSQSGGSGGSWSGVRVL
jgi:hypothetical protein